MSNKIKDFKDMYIKDKESFKKIGQFLLVKAKIVLTNLKIKKLDINRYQMPLQLHDFLHLYSLFLPLYHVI